MPTFGPGSRRELARCLRILGFVGPFSGGRHQFMLKGDVSARIPNPQPRGHWQGVAGANSASGRRQ